MSLLRFASLVVLALWTGGLAVLGLIAAPAIFDAIEPHDPESGRALAGQVFGVVFDRFQRLAWAMGGLLLALYGLRAAIGPRPRRLGLRVWAAAAMLGMSLTGGIVIAPRIDAIRRTTSSAVTSLPDTDPRKIDFRRLHGLSTALMVLTLVAGAGLIWSETRDPHA